MKRPTYIKDEHLDLLNSLSRPMLISLNDLRCCLLDEHQYLKVKEANVIVKYWLKHHWKKSILPAF